MSNNRKLATIFVISLFVLLVFFLGTKVVKEEKKQVGSTGTITGDVVKVEVDKNKTKNMQSDLKKYDYKIQHVIEYEQTTAYFLTINDNKTRKMIIDELKGKEYVKNVVDSRTHDDGFHN